MLVVSGNSAATAANIVTHAGLFHASIVAGIIGAACHIAWTLLFYELFKPVNRTLSLLAAFISMVAIALQAVSTVFQLGPLAVLEGGSSLSALNHEQLDALALIFVRLTADAFYVYVVFFGFWCVVTGYLIFKSGFLPRVIGVLEAIAGMCWLTFLWPPFAHSVSPYNQVVAGIGELSLMGWLLAVGVNAERWKEKADNDRSIMQRC
jgi:hypothetical protein